LPRAVEINRIRRGCAGWLDETSEEAALVMSRLEFPAEQLAPPPPPGYLISVPKAQLLPFNNASLSSMNEFNL